MAASSKGQKGGSKALGADPLEELKISADFNSHNVVKSNKRFADIWVKYGVSKNKEAVRLQPHTCGVSVLNRIPNMPYCHTRLGQEVMRDGYDIDRIQVGWVRKLVSKDRIDNLVKYNQALSDGSDLYPPIYPDSMRNELLASTHMTLALRLFQAGKTSPVTGEIWRVANDEDDLREAVSGSGHCYFELDENCPDEEARFVCEYKNIEQNKNQINTEIQHLRSAQRILKAELRISGQIKLSSVVAKITSDSIVKLRPDHVGDFVKLVYELGPEQYSDELFFYHSIMVNASELCISADWVKNLVTALKGRDALILATTLLHYSGDSVNPQVRPMVL